ncbi:hypothetical protein ACOMHN_026090 [Nucella lapillus]
MSAKETTSRLCMIQTSTRDQRDSLKENAVVLLVDESAPRGSWKLARVAAITLPDNVNFTLTKTGSSAGTTQMRVGTKVSFELQILFPKNTTDMLVELFAPDNDSIVMMLCDVKIKSIGPNLLYTGGANIVMDSQNKSNLFFDRAIIDFGNVTNSFKADNDAAHSSIFITWDAVMIPNEKTQHDVSYWVSAGAEYNYDMEVWVGQASFTAQTDTEPQSFDSPTFNLTGPTSMKVGTSAMFRLDTYIDNPQVYLNVDVYAPLNKTDVMSICAAQVVDTGANFMCGFKPEAITATLHRDRNTRGHDRARMELQTLINKGSRDASNVKGNNRISVEFVVHIYDDASYVGQTYKVGAAVEVGSEKIWAGQISVTATAYAPTANLSPTWKVAKGGSGKVSTSSPLSVSLDMTIPQKTNGKYALEILAPFNNSAAVFQLCSVRVVSLGSNLACTNSNPTPIYTSRGNPQVTDRVLVDLGVLSNVGPWGWQPFNLTDSNATDPDVVRVQFMMKALDHPLATAGSVHGITLGLTVDEIRILVTTLSVEVEAAPVLPNITEAQTPDWTLAFVGNNENVRIGGAGQVLFTITTKRDVIYSPFDLEALMPNSSTGAPQVTLCQVQVHSVGANLPCVVPSALNKSITFTSSFGANSTDYDRAVLKLKSLCNVENQNDTAQDQLSFKIGFKLHNNAGLSNGTEIWPSVGVMFSIYKMWVGQIKAYARADISNSATPPHVAVVKISGDVPVGYVARYNVLVKTVPGNIVPITLNVSVTTPGLSLCSLKVLQVGDNMPCTNASLLEALYEPDINGLNTKASIDFETVANVWTGSLSATSTVDDNTMIVEVMVGVSSDTSVISDRSSHGFSLVVHYDSSAISGTAVPTFTAIHDQSSLTSIGANVSGSEVKVMPITETDNTTDVVAGQAKRLQVCVWTYPQSATELTIKMMTPTGQAGAVELAHIWTSYGGKNMPCVGSCKSGVVTYSSRSGSFLTDIGTVKYGYVINNNFDTTNTDANKVCVDGIFRVQKNVAALTPGATLKPAVSVNVNGVEISVIEQSFTVIDNATFSDIYLDNDTLSTNTLIKTNSSEPTPLCLTPGDVRTLPIVMTVPSFSTSLVRMDVKMDFDLSACMTYREMRLVGVGRNLKGFGKDYDLQCTPKSSNGTTQMDTVVCSLGVVTNPGISQQCKDYTAYDDVVYLEMDFQMADCQKADKDANLSLSLGSKVAGYVAILNETIRVCRDGSEAPVFNLSAQANSSGSQMFVEYNVRLDNTSKAEINKGMLAINLPPFIGFLKLVSSSGTNGVPAVDVSNPARPIINFGQLLLTSEMVIILELSPKPAYKVPNGISGQDSVLPYQVIGEVFARTGSSLPSTTVFSDLGYVSVNVTVTTSSGVSCTASSVNMADSNVIYDCQISVSDPSFTSAVNGRKGGTGWTPYVRDGPLGQKRYFQVYFSNMMRVSRIEVKQSGPAKAIQVKLAYSNDGKAFLDGDTITLVERLEQIVTVPRPRDSQVLRVYVTKSNPSDQKVSLTFDFIGCATSTGGPTTSTAVCAAVNAAIPSKTTDALFFSRSFLEVPSKGVFVCDKVEKAPACFLSADGSTWQSLDSRVASVVGYHPETNAVYGMHQNKQVMMSSHDLGNTWDTAPREALTKAQGDATFVLAKDVPMGDSAQLTPGIASPNWRATYNYMQQNSGGWNNKVKWNCC